MRFLQELPECPAITNKGPKSSVSRWFSWNHAMSFQMPHHHTKLLVGVFLGLRKGWWKHYSQLWDEVAPLAPEPVVAVAEAAPAAVAKAGPKAVEVAEAAPAADEVVAPRPGDAVFRCGCFRVAVWDVCG